MLLLALYENSFGLFGIQWNVFYHENYSVQYYNTYRWLNIKRENKRSKVQENSISRKRCTIYLKIHIHFINLSLMSYFVAFMLHFLYKRLCWGYVVFLFVIIERICLGNLLHSTTVNSTATYSFFSSFLQWWQIHILCI